MALEQRLSLKLSQKLVMTPALQQAIKLLQMTRMELEGVLTQELEENPLLEEPEDDPAEEQGELEEPAEEQVDEDPMMDDIDLDAYFNEYLEASSERASGTYEPRDAVPIEATVAAQEDLYDHLLWQLQMLDLDPRIREIAELVIGNLDEDGFLAATVEELRLLGASGDESAEYRQSISRLQSLEAVVEPSGEGGEVEEAPTPPLDSATPTGKTPADPADTTAADAAQAGTDLNTAEQRSEFGLASLEIPGYSQVDVETAITIVQALEPAGIACQSLQESLLAQLVALGEEDTVTFRLVKDYWDMCLRRQFVLIAKDLGVPLQELKAPSERIGQLETRPGRKYGGERTHYVEPDVYVVNVGGEFVVQVNDDGLPKLRVSKAYRSMLREMKVKGSDGEAQAYIKDKMRSAMWLIKSIDQRQRTIYKVAESIVKQQRGFFEKGIEYLRPMVLRDVAEDIEMHESTVSRVVSNKYIHTPRGLHPMKFFFHSGIDRDIGGDISSLTVKRKIKHLVEAEDPKRPLSDSVLMNRLKAEGIRIARRTVAKYRDELRIPSSTDRKQVF